ncbi:MAG: prolyl oligopeptidase family serine peptidase [Chitinispirillaceae bacterium]|nr:prolyl oligopeptidase family serine peptidase [Chitinispirillaceae bacterium]
MSNKQSVFVLSIIFYSITLCTAQFGASYKWNNSGSNLPSGYKHETYHSSLINTDIGYVIYLPPDYNNSSDRYPVIYSLHGMGGNENSNSQNYSGVLQSGITSNSFPPVIVVFINGRGNTFYSNSKDGKVKCESSIMTELIPHIDSTYRTKKDRTQRAIEGMSMGGFGALMLGFKYPEMFASIATYDAALVNWDTLSQQQFDRSTPNDIFGNDRNYFNENSYPFTFLKKNSATIKTLGIQIRMITGDNDKQMGPLYYYNLSMRDSLQANGISLDFKVIPGGTHGSGMNATTIKENMIFHTTNFNAAITDINRRSVFKKPSGSIQPEAFTLSAGGSFNIYQYRQHSNGFTRVYDFRGRVAGVIPGSGLNKKRLGSAVYIISTK